MALAHRQRCKKHVLGSDQDTATSRSLERVRRAELRQHVAAAIRRRRAFVFLDPFLGERVGDFKILVAENVVHHVSAFRHRRRGIAGTRPCTLYQNDSRRNLYIRLSVIGKISAVPGGVLCPKLRRYGQADNDQETRESQSSYFSFQSRQSRAVARRMSHASFSSWETGEIREYLARANPTKTTMSAGSPGSPAVAGS